MKQLLFVIVCFFAFGYLSVGVANAQTANAYGGYNTGYGTVYGSFGQAMATQNIYNTMQMQMQKTMMRNAMIKKWGLAAVEKAEREAGAGSSSSSRSKASGASTSSRSEMVVAPPRVVRNHGKFRADPTVDTGKALADALGETPEEKDLIGRIYAATKAAYEQEAASKGWQNNIAAGLTFFTVAAMTVYRNAEEPSDDAVNNYFNVVNGALDEIPEFATVTNKDKQSYNNMLIGFGGMLLAGNLEGKQNNDAATIANYQKLAGMMIQMVLKTDPENLRIENGQIVMK